MITVMNIFHSDFKQMVMHIVHGEMRTNQVVLKKWTGVAVWTFDIKCDTCAICKNALMESCIQCQADNLDQKDCTIVRGTCNHVYHFHCISNWMKTSAKCPLDNQDWEFQKYD